MITIIGSGKVGGDAALFSALKKLDDQILLLDVAEGLPQGEAMDINHMLSEQGIDVEVKGSKRFCRYERIKHCCGGCRFRKKARNDKDGFVKD